MLSEAGAEQLDVQTSNRSPFEINLALDAGVTLGGLLVLELPFLFVNESISPACGLECDSASVNAFDRTVIGNRSSTAGLISHLGLGVSLSLPFLLGAADVMISSPADGWSGFGKDAVVLVETFAISLSATNVLKTVFRRPRPYVYDPTVPEAKRQLGRAAMSFPSGHASVAFAMATAGSYTFTRRHPDNPWTILVWIGAYAIAGTTGVMRTQSGDHFWTDVLAGAVLGTGVGLLVPWLHEGSGDQGPLPSVAPLVTSDGGLGVVLTFHSPTPG